MATMAQNSEAKETYFTRLADAVGNLRIADSNCASVAYTLVGDEPQEAGSALKAVPYSGDGALGEVGKLANEINEIASRMNSNIARIQSRL